MRGRKSRAGLDPVQERKSNNRIRGKKVERGLGKGAGEQEQDQGEINE